MAREKVLVVDDNPANLKLLRVLLDAEGYEVQGARDATEALAALDRDRPDLVLMDVQLPGVDGLTLTRTLRANPAYQDLVILAVTSYAMKGDRERALSAGCNGYISKPINTRTLPSMIANVLRPAEQQQHPELEGGDTGDGEPRSDRRR